MLILYLNFFAVNFTLKIVYTIWASQRSPDIVSLNDYFSESILQILIRMNFFLHYISSIFHLGSQKPKIADFVRSS